MKHIYNFRNFSINETRLILEGLSESPLKLSPGEMETLRQSMKNWYKKNYGLKAIISRNGGAQDVLKSLLAWVSRDQEFDLPSIKTADTVELKKIASSPEIVGKVNQIEEKFLDWVYFFGCTLNENNPMYDQLRASLGRPSGNYTSMKIPYLRTNEPENLKQRLISKGLPVVSFPIFAALLVSGLGATLIASALPFVTLLGIGQAIRDGIRDRADNKAAEMDARNMVEINLLNDDGFKELIRVCNEIVAMSGIEKEVNIETNTNQQSQVETPNRNQDMAPIEDVAPPQKNIKPSGPKSRPKPKKPTKQTRTFRT
jgi:hypothetical protein